MFWYKKQTCETGRGACGSYYPIKSVNEKHYLQPHQYKESICW